MGWSHSVNIVVSKAKMFRGGCNFRSENGFDGPKDVSSKTRISPLTCENNVTSGALGAATTPNGLKGGKMDT
jgi:hypothetical protein